MAGLENCGKSRPPPGFDPQTIQPVASRYTNYATRPTHSDVLNVIPGFRCGGKQDLRSFGGFKQRRMAANAFQTLPYF
jgi:hypothetical protein